MLQLNYIKDNLILTNRLIVEFCEEDLEKVFPNPVEIEILKIEEVSNHYE